jgi:hypothetical protein
MTPVTEMGLPTILVLGISRSDVDVTQCDDRTTAVPAFIGNQLCFPEQSTITVSLNGENI